MPLLDSKGKLFGKINIIDLAVIIAIIVACILSLKLVYKLASTGSIMDTNWISIFMI